MPFNPIPLRGSFTPTFTFPTVGNLSNAYTTQTGLYERIGNVVFIYYRLNVTPTHTTASGTARLGGLPFTVGSLSAPMPCRMISTHAYPGATGTMVYGVPTAGQSYIELYSSKSAGGETGWDHSAITSATAFNLALTGFYFV